MSKRRHQDAELEDEDLAQHVKRPTPLGKDTSDEEALNCLNKLSSFLGLDDLGQEETAGGLFETPFISTPNHTRFTLPLLPISF